MAQYGFFFDASRCTGCKTCEFACKDYKDLTTEFAFRKVYEVAGGQTTRDEDGCIQTTCFSYNVSSSCQHCDNPACVAACPTGASYIAEDGTVQIDDEKCVGCDACVAACPYEARYHVDEENIVRKCTFCHHRTQLGMLPACVGACVAGARMFGDLNDPDSDISKAIAAAGETDVLLPEEGLGPEIHYIGLNSALAMKRVSNVQQGGNVKTPYEM